MAELADALRSGRSGPRSCGFESHLRHHFFPQNAPQMCHLVPFSTSKRLKSVYISHIGYFNLEIAMAGKVIKLDIGTVYQKTVNGSYYFRYQVNGQRKAVSLKTGNQKEAIAKAEELLPVVKATTTEVISAHVKHARGLVTRKRALSLSRVWEIYSKHPERATPATVSE